MRSDLVSRLACPECKGALRLEGATSAKGDVISGTLRCAGCGTTFGVHGGVPDLLPVRYRDIPASKMPGAN